MYTHIYIFEDISIRKTNTMCKNRYTYHFTKYLCFFLKNKGHNFIWPFCLEAQKVMTLYRMYNLNCILLIMPFSNSQY